MKISYDNKVDAMYISLKKGKYDRSEKVSDRVVVDLTKDGEVLGLELLDAKAQFGNIKPLTIEFTSKPSYQS